MRSFSSQSYTQNPPRLEGCACVLQHMEGKSEREGIMKSNDEKTFFFFIQKKKRFSKTNEEGRLVALWNRVWSNKTRITWFILKEREFLLVAGNKRSTLKNILDSWSSCTKTWTKEECKVIALPLTAITCGYSRIKQEICRLFGSSMILTFLCVMWT